MKKILEFVFTGLILFILGSFAWFSCLISSRNEIENKNKKNRKKG